MEIFNKRPSQPKYLFVWDISILVIFMKLLSLKFAANIGLQSSEKLSEIWYLDVRFITFKPNSVVLHFSHTAKS